MKKTLFLFAATTLMLLSCKKDNEDANQIDKKNIIGSYKITSVKISTLSSGINTPEYEAVDDQPDCEKDDTIIFKENDVVVWVDKGIKCGDADEDVSNWQLNGNLLRFEADDEVIEYTIISFTKSELKIVTTVKDGVTDYMTTKLTLTRQ